MLAPESMPDISQYIRELAIIAVPLLMALSFHETAHGFMAYLLGDPTAKQQGRLTLNPLKHLDPMGTVVFVVTRMIGWAKPVPVDARYFKNPPKGMMLVAMSGPGTNLLLAAAFAALFHLSGNIQLSGTDTLAFKVLAPVVNMLYAGVYINLVLAVFNLLPIPPLDGSNIVAGLLPRRTAARYMSFSRYGILVILVLVLAGSLLGMSVLGSVLWPPVHALAGLLGME